MAQRETLLAIDTSTATCVVGLAHDGQVTEDTLSETRNHARSVMALIDRVLAAAGCRLQDVQGIVYGAGPGSFTGIRIAIAVAQGLASGAALPVLGVSSLRALAQSALRGRDDIDTLLVAQDARMGEVYAGRYARRDGIATALTSEALLAPAAVDVAGVFAATGTGIAVSDALVARLAVVAAEILPATMEARALLEIAATARSGDWTPAAAAAPVYLRQQVAQRPQ